VHRLLFSSTQHVAAMLIELRRVSVFDILLTKL